MSVPLTCKAIVTAIALAGFARAAPAQTSAEPVPAPAVCPKGYDALCNALNSSRAGSAEIGSQAGTGGKSTAFVRPEVLKDNEALRLAADVNAVADAVLSEAISRTQNLMVSMSQGCPGGASGVPPLNWNNLQTRGNSAVNALNAAKLALIKNQPANAVQQINSAQGELDALVNGAHNNCSGGASGVDPVNYGSYLAIRDTVKAKLDVGKEFLK